MIVPIIKRCYQKNIDKATEELLADILKNITESPEVNLAVEQYRELKHRMAEAETAEAREKLVEEIAATPEFKGWLKAELAKDSRRSKKRIPEDRDKRVSLYIASLKSGLPAVIPTAVFTESKDKWGRTGLWRVQSNGYLTGLAVLDLDHVKDAGAKVDEWLQRKDFGELGILWIFITASGEGVKVVFKAREEWGNLIDNAYQMAEMLGVLDYADGACKNSDHCHFVPRSSDIRYIDWEGLFGYENPAYEQRYGAAYREGNSEPTQPRWQELERQRKAAREKGAAPQETPAAAATAPQTLSVRENAIVDALNSHYGMRLAEGRRHETFLGETAPWLLLLCDNNADKALAMARRLNYVINWTDQAPGELESCIATVSKKPLLTRRPKALDDLLRKAGVDGEVAELDEEAGKDDLPFDEWIEKIGSLFDVYPCLREVCEPHPKRLWPFLFFASGALLGTCMTATWYYFYDRPEKRRRLNYNVLGIGDPASGKGALERIAGLLTEPIERADELANEAINTWKEEQRSKGANKDKTQKPKGVVRLHGARTSNNVFINDMINAWTEVDGERIQQHMLTVDTEAINSVKMQKGGSWIDKQVMEIKAFSNEKDSQQYANLDSVSGFFNVYWNLVRTCTPPALKMLCNDRNFGTGYPTRLSVIPVPGTGFQMIELRRRSPETEASDTKLLDWAYKADKRHGELPLWPLVEHCWHWTDRHMEIAAFNEDKADELLLKRVAQCSLCIAAPFVDMRHWDEREASEDGSYEVDDTDKGLMDLVLDIQYRTQHHFFGELARNYFNEQLNDATRFRRRTSRYEQCFLQLPDIFTTDLFAKTYGFANNHSANKAIQRMLDDKVIERTKRGEYRKRVTSIS